TATAAAFLPVAASLAIGVGHHPLVLTVPVAIAASCAFMMPVATPPNAIVYGTGRLSISQMVRAGFFLNLVLIALITVLAVTLVPRVWGSCSRAHGSVLHPMTPGSSTIDVPYSHHPLSAPKVLPVMKSPIARKIQTSPARRRSSVHRLGLRGS